MHEIGLIYKGKKKPFEYDNPRTGKLKFTPGVVTWVSVKAAEFLMAVNPSMFKKAGERGIQTESMESADDIIKSKMLRDAEEAKEDAALESPEIIPETETTEKTETAGFLTCEKCGRKYAERQKKWYDQHIAKCEG